MTEASTQTQSVVVERDLEFPPEKVWRALTQPHLIEEWLMKNDFKADEGQTFTMSGDWGSVDCKVLKNDPGKALTYSWVGMGIDTVVTWELTPTATGTRLRMVQSGFTAGQEQARNEAEHGWMQFLDKLDGVLSTME